MRRVGRDGWLVAAALLCTVAFARGVAGHEQEGYVLGVLPYQAPARIGKAFAPVAAAFGRVLDVHVHLQTSTTMRTFAAHLEEEAFDIALVDPVNAVRLVDAGAYRPLARRPSYPAAIVVTSDSTIRVAADLRGRAVGLMPRGSPVDVFVGLSLEDLDLIPVRDFRVERMAPGECLHQLLLRTLDACATGGGAAAKTFERKMGVRLRKVLETRPFPHMVFLAHARVPAPHSDTVRDTVLGWTGNEDGRRLLTGIGPDAAFIAYRDSDYDIVREAVAAWQQNEAPVP